MDTNPASPDPKWVTHFLTQANPFLAEGRKLRLRVIALRINGKWVANTIIGFAGTNPLPAAHLPETPSLVTLEEIVDGLEMVRVLRDVASGKLAIGAATIHLPVDSQGRQERSGSSLLMHREYSHGQFGIPSAFVQLTISQNSMGPIPEDLFERVEAELQSHDPPFDGLKDLRETLLHASRQNWAHAMNPEIIFLVPTQVTISRLNCDGRRATATLERQSAHSWEGIHLAFLAKGADKTWSRRMVHSSDLRRETESSASAEVDFPSSPVLVKAILTRYGFELGRLESTAPAAVPPSQRMRIVQATHLGWPKNLDSDLKERDFEAWMADFFFVLGFAPTWSGRHKNGQVDLIALPTSDDFFLSVECTNFAHDFDAKLAKLGQRTTHLEQLLSMRALPVMVTLQNRKDLNDVDVERAARDGTSLLTRDHLEELLAMAPTATHAELISKLDEFVPRAATAGSTGQTWSVTRRRRDPPTSNYL